MPVHPQTTARKRELPSQGTIEFACSLPLSPPSPADGGTPRGRWMRRGWGLPISYGLLDVPETAKRALTAASHHRSSPPLLQVRRW